jgi:flagellar basal-body rod protein FlgC
MSTSSLVDSLSASTAGLKAQSMRIRVIAENIANAQTTGKTAAELPYRRQEVTFANELDRATGMDLVKVDKVSSDSSPFQRRYLPGHPAADTDGYVQFPNVNSLIETMDMREAQRSYEANLNVMEVSRMMLMRTIDLLRT